MRAVSRMLPHARIEVWNSHFNIYNKSQLQNYLLKQFGKIGSRPKDALECGGWTPPHSKGFAVAILSFRDYIR